MTAPIPYSKPVENYIKKCIRGGVTIKDMLAGMQKYQNAPKHASTLYKLYGNVIAEEKADLNQKVGSKVIDQALAGDFKSQELFLRSKAGWSPTHTVNEVDQNNDPDTDLSAMDSLLELLGKKDEDDLSREDDYQQ